MTTFVVNGDTFVDVRSFSLSGGWKNGQSVYTTNKAAVVQSSESTLLFEGTGFESFDQHGFATSGTVTRFALFADGLSLDFADFEVDAAEFQQIFRHERESDFANILFNGDDDISVGSGAAALAGFDGDDTMTGGTSDDALFGGQGNDLLRGGKGLDDLYGGRDTDQLQGGKGADKFIFENVTESRKGSIDRILDLQDVDEISLFVIDADTTVASDQAFVLVAAFTDDPGQLTVKFKASRDRTEIKGDVDGDGKADLIIYAEGDHEDFVNFIL